MPPTITTDSGTIAVPMSTILDALEDVLTEAERKALFGQLIGLRPSGVAPGDLITAELFNRVLEDVNNLQQRVALLEAGTDIVAKKPVIHQIIPTTVRAGEELIVIGENLNPALLTRIDVEQTNVPLNRLKNGSGPTQLVFEAPVVMTLPPNGAQVILSVSNSAGTDTDTYFQLPAMASQIQAKISFKLKSITPQETFKPNSTYDHLFDIEVQSSHDETFTIAPQIDGQGFTAKVKDSDKIEATAATAATPLKTTRTITVVTGPAGTGNLLLTAKGTKFPAFTTTSQPTKVQVAAAQEIPTPNITFKAPVTAGQNSNFKNNAFSIKRQPIVPAKIGLGLQFTFGRAESYQVTGLTGPQGWTVVRAGSQDPIPSGGPDTVGTVNLLFTPTNDGTQFTASDGQFGFTLTSGDQKDKLTFTAGLKLVEFLP
ncbi:MAG TPA: IPT/TIG domain-containing protein [Allosphingosinicella sp.]|nr:IPT/TIG domain-containing protein [Allosphingosinicella sp.]